MTNRTEDTHKKLKEFVKSSNKSCLVTGTDLDNKRLEILRYLNSLDKKLRILIRVNSMSNTRQMFMENRKTGIPYTIGSLTIYFDSMNKKSQQKTPDKFNCIIVYPINTLKGITDDNLLDIIKYKECEKIFWISHLDNKDFEYLKLICDIEHNIIINNTDEEVHKRVGDNSYTIKKENYAELIVDNLGYHTVENAISEKYNLGMINSSSLGGEMIVGDFDSFLICGQKKRGTFFIKAKRHKDKYKLIVKKSIWD